MATIKHIFKGESLSMLFAFPAEYDMARIQSHGIWIGGTEFTGVIIGQGIELKLTSVQTDLMSGNQRVSLWIDDTILGVRKPYVGDLAVGNTNALPDNESTSEVYDVIVNVDISVTSIEAGDLMFNYVKGEKGDPFTYDDLTPEQKAELKGEKGEKGDTGEKGDKGEKGETGADGVGLNYLGIVPTEADLPIDYTGLPNDAYVVDTTYHAWKWNGTTWIDVGSFAGKSAYALAVDEGYAGTLQQWLLSLKGEQGIQGIQGIQGVQGDKGDKGDKGDAFVYADFTPAQLLALKGDKGDKGDTGATGANGQDGADGYTPIKGIDYFDGAKGDKGDKGDKGEKGDTGATGASGNYLSEIVTSPTTGTLTLKNSTETVLDGSLTGANTFTVALPTPTAGQVNESILIFKIGASLPTITQPTGIVWRGATPTLAISTNWTIVYEQVNTTGTTYEIWAVATKNA